MSRSVGSMFLFCVSLHPKSCMYNGLTKSSIGHWRHLVEVCFSLLKPWSPVVQEISFFSNRNIFSLRATYPNWSFSNQYYIVPMDKTHLFQNKLWLKYVSNNTWLYSTHLILLDPSPLQWWCWGMGSAPSFGRIGGSMGPECLTMHPTLWWR
jgi:hypothetical protein